MNIHKNARLTPLRREEMALAVLDGRLTKAQAARVYGVTSKIVSRWVERHKTGGRAAMMDRSSRPRVTPRQICQVLAQRIIALRRQRLTGKHKDSTLYQAFVKSTKSNSPDTGVRQSSQTCDGSPSICVVSE